MQSENVHAILKEKREREHNQVDKKNPVNTEVEQKGNLVIDSNINLPPQLVL